MSKCHFPYDNFTIILDMPPTSLLNNTLRFIQTNNNICISSFLSISCFEKQQLDNRTYDLLKQQDGQDSLGAELMNSRVGLEEQESDGSGVKKKKMGCTCKKTNCIKMYCQCFSVGKMCTPECACYGCYNHHEHQGVLQKAKHNLKTRSLVHNRHSHKGCNCKKTHCQKKYCECFNAGLTCGEACNCNECCNKEGKEEGESHEH